MTAIAVPAVRTRRPGTGTVYAWELRKLLAQKRTFIGIGAAIAVPLIFIVALVPRTATLEELFFRMTEGEPPSANGRARTEAIGASA